MNIAYLILAALALICIIVFTRHIWDKPKETIDMIATYDIILKKALSLGPNAKLIELRENFVKAGIRNQNGEKAFMVKKRPGNEFRVLYISKYDKDYEDFKFNHVYTDGADQNEIVAQFEKEIKESLVKRS